MLLYEILPQTYLHLKESIREIQEAKENGLGYRIVIVNSLLGHMSCLLQSVSGKPYNKKMLSKQIKA